MPVQPLRQIPNGSDVFIDANIFIYGFMGQSAQCKVLLERCSREEVIGITLFEIVSEATHRFMLAEARSKGLIPKENASELRKRFNVIQSLTDYWRDTEIILNLNLLFLATDESIVKSAQTERQSAGLLTNDSMIVSCMHSYGISFLATNDADFERVPDIAVFRPDDLP